MHKKQRRTNLWFGQFDTSIKIYMPEASVLRVADHKKIDKILQIRKDWGRRMRNAANPGSWLNAWEPIVITDDLADNLHAMCDFLLANNDPCKVTISGHQIYIYTQGSALVDRILALPFINPAACTVSTCDVVGTPNTIRLRKAKHKYRSYFRNLLLDSKQQQNLRSFLLAQQDVRMAPSLLDWANWNRDSRLREHFFIDHDDNGILLMMALVHNRLIRKTLDIVADK